MPSNRRRFLEDLMRGGVALVPSALRPASAQSQAAGKPVVCRVVDAASGQPTAARIRLLDVRGEEVVPMGHPATLPENAQEGDVRFQRRRFAYVSGAFELDPRLLPLRYQ